MEQSKIIKMIEINPMIIKDIEEHVIDACN